LSILFISGIKKPNECGITDYICLLTKELKLRGKVVNYFSICKKQTQANFAQTIPNADLYSIQFAPYAFSPSGLSGNSLLEMAKALANKNVHVNFHEIWIGAYPNASWKERYLGWRQKKEILNFIKYLKPKLISCSNSAVFNLLSQSGIKSKYLYLFGNIPFSQLQEYKSNNDLEIVFFGSTYKNFPYDLLALRLDEISQFLNKSVKIKIIGRQRENQGVHKLRRISKKYNFVIHEIGELPTDAISKIFQGCDIGVSTTPYDILGKSGATMAMLEHGLPVLIFDDGDTSKDLLLKNEEFSDQIFLLNKQIKPNPIISFMSKPRKTFFNGVVHTANKMLKILY